MYYIYLLGILRKTENKTIHRYLILWADHASILSAGFLLLTVKVVYDKDIFYTDEELLKTTGFPYDVQELVEEPFIYVLGHTSDSIAEKLSYVETRLEDLKEISTTLEMNGKQVTDTMRFFHGT